jgi:N6-adenosine-specific RNA methylase IME4
MQECADVHLRVNGLANLGLELAEASQIELFASERRRGWDSWGDHDVAARALLDQSAS